MQGRMKERETLEGGGNGGKASAGGLRKEGTFTDRERGGLQDAPRISMSREGEGRRVRGLQDAPDVTRARRRAEEVVPPPARKPSWASEWR